MLIDTLKGKPQIAETQLKPYTVSYPKDVEAILCAGISHDFNSQKGLTKSEQDWYKDKDIGNIYNPGTNDAPRGIYPVVNETFKLLTSGKLDIHKHTKLLERLLGPYTHILRLVHRWGGFCFSHEQEIEMKELIARKDFAGFSKFLDKNGEIKGRVVGDGNVLEHQTRQSLLIKAYGQYDLLNVIPGTTNEREEGIVLSAADYVVLQLLGLTHDSGEYGKGDVLYDLKGTEDRSSEEECGKELLQSLGLGQKLENAALRTYAIDFDTSHYLKTLFSLYEKMSYVYGAMQVYKTIETENEVMKALALIHNVLKNQITPMIKAARGTEVDFPLRSMQHFLRDNAQTIDAMFRAAGDISISNERDKKAYETAKSDWEIYKKGF